MRSRVHVLAYVPAIIMLLLVLMPMGITALASTELALTNKRIIGRVRKQHLTIPFEEIESVRVRRGILGLIFNFGSLTIKGNGINVRFPGINRPADMKAMIDNAVEQTLFPMAAEKIPATPKPEAAKPLTAKPAEKPAEKPVEKPAAPPPETPPANMLEEKMLTQPPADSKYKDPNTW